MTSPAQKMKFLIKDFFGKDFFFFIFTEEILNPFKMEAVIMEKTVHLFAPQINGLVSI